VPFFFYRTLTTKKKPISPSITQFIYLFLKKNALRKNISHSTDLCFFLRLLFRFFFRSLIFFRFGFFLIRNTDIWSNDFNFQEKNLKITGLEHKANIITRLNVRGREEVPATAIAKINRQKSMRLITTTSRDILTA